MKEIGEKEVFRDDLTHSKRVKWRPVMDELIRGKVEKTVFSRLGIGLSLMLFATSVFSYSALSLVEFFAPESMGNINVTIVVSMLTMYVIGIITYFFLKRWVPGNPINDPEDQAPVKIRPLGFMKLVLISLGLGFILNVATILMNFIKNSRDTFAEWSEYVRQYLEYGDTVVPEPPPLVEMDPLMDILGGLNPVVLILFVVVFTSIFEEFIFRKLLYDKLIAFGGKVFIIVSSLMFALFHVNQHQLIYTFGIGLVFAGVMYFTKKISYCILLHMFFNLFGVLALQATSLPEGVMALYYVFHFGLVVLGIVFLIKWLSTYRLRIKFEPRESSIGKVKNIFINPGMIVFVVITVGVMILNDIMI